MSNEIEESSHGTPVLVTAADLRAALARSRVPIYLVSARVMLNPVALGLVLNEHSDLNQELAEQVLRAIEEIAAAPRSLSPRRFFSLKRKRA